MSEIKTETACVMARPEILENGQVDVLLSPVEEKRLLRKIDLQ